MINNQNLKIVIKYVGHNKLEQVDIYLIQVGKRLLKVMEVQSLLHGWNFKVVAFIKMARIQ